MSSLAKHVIRQPKPFRCILIVFASIAITATSLWLYQQQATAQLFSQAKMLTEQNQILSTENQQLSNNNLRQAEQLESHQHYLAIQQATDEQLQLQLTQLQNDVVRLNKELMFYQNITQGTSDTKLQIRELHLRQDIAPSDKINYRLVITQGKRINKPITGTIIVTLNKQGENIVISERPLNLRHVQVLEGQIELTDNITPDNITITLKQQKKTTLTQTFDWQIDNN